MGRLISRGLKTHVCKPPGWLERRREGIKKSAIWQCTEMVSRPDPGNRSLNHADYVIDECGKYWQWRCYDGLPWSWDNITVALPEASGGPAPGAWDVPPPPPV